MLFFSPKSSAWIVQIWVKRFDKAISQEVDAKVASYLRCTEAIEDIFCYYATDQQMGEYLRYYIESPTQACSFGIISMRDYRDCERTLEECMSGITAPAYGFSNLR